ncbi:MAG: hypothetical protein JW936_04140 [Sedimentisphaerales bacterium]|nr:hypothetical protein [Sedimentisphaerales bacterium]
MLKYVSLIIILLCCSVSFGTQIDSLSASSSASITRPVASPFGGFEIAGPVSPVYSYSAESYSLLTSGETSIGNNVTINGLAGFDGNIYAGNGTAFGDSVFTSGTFGGENNLTIAGDLVYGQQSWINPKITVGGSIVGPTNSWTTVSFTNPGLTTSGTDSLWYENKSSNTLTAGDYGSLSTGNQANIYVSAGTYNFGSVWLGNNTNIIADTSAGNVIINAVGSFSTGQNVSISYVGSGGVMVQSGNDLSLGESNEIAANIRSFGSMNVGNNNVINGRVFARGQTWIGNNSHIAGVGSSVGVPEPATLLMLMPGAYLCLRKKYRNSAIR